MSFLKAGWPCKRSGCKNVTAHNTRFCDECTLYHAVFGEAEAVSGVAQCPFCGTIPGLRTLDQHEFFCVCPKCDAHGPLVADEELAARAFGLRTETPQDWLSAKKRGVEDYHVKGRPAPGARPCPFCGGSDLFFDRAGKVGGSLAVNSVGCQTCEAAGPGVKGDAVEAVEVWNQRIDRQRTE